MITLDDIVSRLDKAQEHQRYWSGVCPFHDDHKPSLLVFKDGWFRCLACGKAGDWMVLWRGLSGWTGTEFQEEKTSWTAPYLSADVRESEELTNRAHDMLCNHLTSLDWYLRRRKIENRIEPCRLGWWNGWYTIPIYSKTKQFRGLVMRASLHVQEASHGQQRFTTPPQQLPLLYVPDRHIIEEAKYLLVVFGMFDALALSSLREPVCTTTAGAQSFKPEWLDFFRHKCIVIPDKGEEREGIRLAGHLGWRGCLLKLDYGDCKDPAEMVEKGKHIELLNQIHRKV